MEFEVANGSINYEIYGEGIPILILHSMGTDHRSMTAWMEPVFSNLTEWKRIYIDLPSHGRSRINSLVKSSDDMVASLIEFIDKTIPDQPFLLVGMSFGGYLAQGIFHKKHKFVRGICLLAPALHKRERTLPQKAILKKDEELLTDLEDDIKAAFQTLMIYQTKSSLESFLNEIQPGRLLANREFLASDWRINGYFLNEEPFSNVGELKQPALFILGRQDSICGYKDHFALLEKFPNSSFAILDGAGHLLPIDKRELVQGLLEDWIKRISNEIHSTL